MTKEEFLNLDYGTILVCERYPDKAYEVDEVDVFVTNSKGQENCVYGAVDRVHHTAIRIDIQNYPSWNILAEEK